MLAVGHRRRITAASILVLAGPLDTEFFPPQLFAVRVVANKSIFRRRFRHLARAEAERLRRVADRRRDENPIAPHRRRRASLAGQVHFPGYASGIRELDREFTVGRYAGSVRTAPLRPVLGRCRELPW